jgi:hypothetical protein
MLETNEVINNLYQDSFNLRNDANDKLNQEEKINSVLDFINECKLKIETIKSDVEHITEILWEKFNEIDGSSKEILEDLKLSYQSLKDYINIFEKKPIFKEALNNSIIEFNNKLDDFKEIIDDLNKKLHIYPENKEIQELVNKIIALPKK